MKEKSVMFVVIFCILFFGVGIWYLSYQQQEALLRWNEMCYHKGLPDKCLPIQECSKDCHDLDMWYYKFENGGLFNDDNCWCKGKDIPKQIW